MAARLEATDASSSAKRVLAGLRLLYTGLQLLERRSGDLAEEESALLTEAVGALCVRMCSGVLVISGLGQFGGRAGLQGRQEGLLGVQDVLATLYEMRRGCTRYSPSLTLLALSPTSPFICVSPRLVVLMDVWLVGCMHSVSARLAGAALDSLLTPVSIISQTGTP